MARKFNQPDELLEQKASVEETVEPQTETNMEQIAAATGEIPEDGLNFQTETEINDDEIDDEQKSELLDELLINPDGISQTETETAQKQAKNTIGVPEVSLNSDFHQTGIENNEMTDKPVGGKWPGTQGNYLDTSISQTGTENGEMTSGTAGEKEPNRQINNPDTPVSQTGIKNTENESNADSKPASKRKAARKTNINSESGETDATQSQSDSVPPTRRRRRSTPIVSIDENRSVETDADKMKNDLLDLVESLKGKKILTGTIQGVERSAGTTNNSFAVLYHGDFKVIIPAEETVEAPADFRGLLPSDVMHYMVTKRLGAEVDFIVKGVDPKTGIAAASRLEAMAMKRRQYYFGSDRSGNNLLQRSPLYEGISAEARIVSVIRAGIFVDLFGVESYIPLRELSYQRWLDASVYFQPGQRVLVKLLSIDRSDRNKIVVAASVKQAGENPYEKALRRYTPGNRYVGTVSMVDTNGVFVSLDGGVDCLCSYPKRGRPPRGSRVTVRIIGINNENNRIWGAITHMNTPR